MEDNLEGYNIFNSDEELIGSLSEPEQEDGLWSAQLTSSGRSDEDKDLGNYSSLSEAAMAVSGAYSSRQFDETMVGRTLNWLLGDD